MHPMENETIDRAANGMNWTSSSQQCSMTHVPLSHNNNNKNGTVQEQEQRKATANKNNIFASDRLKNTTMNTSSTNRSKLNHCLAREHNYESRKSKQYRMHRRTTRQTSAFFFLAIMSLLQFQMVMAQVSTPAPTSAFSNAPSAQQTKSPTRKPSHGPSQAPSKRPTASPTSPPTLKPSSSPSPKPSPSPSNQPTSSPTSKPSLKPSDSPSSSPSISPSSSPSVSPSSSPSYQPSSLPSVSPFGQPSSVPTSKPSIHPTLRPTTQPSIHPTAQPSSSPSDEPSNKPSVSPTRSNAPSSQPSSQPSSEPSPSPTSEPTSSPSVTPSDYPSFKPSSSPSFTLQEFEFYITMEFDDLDVFGGKAEKIFEKETDELIKTHLDRELGEDFSVVTSIKNTQTIDPEDVILNANTQQRHRQMQQTTTGLRVYLDVFVDVRSGTPYTTELLIKDTKTGLDDQSERESFILSLQLSDSSFQTINFMNKFTINNEEITLKTRDSSIPWIYVGPGIGAGALLASLIGFLFARKRRDDMSFVEGEFYDPPPMDPRVSSTINVMDDAGDLSTLGDPVNPHGHGMFAEVQMDETGNQSHMSTDYDYKRAYGGVGDEASVSTAGGTKSGYAPHAMADLMNDETMSRQSRQRASSDNSSKMMKSVGGNISMFSEDESFEAMYNQEEKFMVTAPPGKLGIVIDTPSAGVPVVHAIKDSSALVDKVRIGDKLVSVDGIDTTSLSAIRVSKIISSRAENQRMMVFSRSRNEP